MKGPTKLRYNLQFFAAGGSTNNSSNQEGSTGEQNTANQNESQGNGENTGDQNQNSNSGAKTFTQEEVSAIGAKEKNQGKNSILKMFDCADEETAKKQAEEFKKWKSEQLTDEQRREEEKAKLQNSASESEKRAVAAENKLAAMQAGISLDSLEDALAIALRKVTDDKPLDKVFEEMKKEQRYSGFFGASSSSGGTGSSADHNKNGQNNNQGNIGKRLAEQRTSNSPTKSNFFTN